VNYGGVFSLLITPFAPNGEIDWEAYKQLVEYHCQVGVDGLFAVCGTSQMALLEWEECLELARKAVEWSSVPVVATGNCTSYIDRHILQVRQMAGTGVDGVVLVPPPTPIPDRRTLIRYYSKLAGVLDTDILLYEWPHRPECEFPPEIYGELVHRLGIKGIKDTTCKLSSIKAKISHKHDSTIFQANIPLLVDSLDAGAGGIMAIVSAGCPALVTAFWQAYREGDHRCYRTFHYLLVTLDAILSSDHPRTSQYLLQLQGLNIAVRARGVEEGLPETRKKAVATWWEMARLFLFDFRRSGI